MTHVIFGSNIYDATLTLTFKDLPASTREVIHHKLEKECDRCGKEIDPLEKHKICIGVENPGNCHKVCDNCLSYLCSLRRY